MSLWGLSQIIDVAKQNKKEKQVRELLTEKGYSEEHISFCVRSLDYMWLNNRHKKKFIKNTGVTKKDVEERVNFCFLIMLRHEDIANVLISNKKKALRTHQDAVEATKHWGSELIELLMKE